MCGIAGIISLENNNNISPKSLVEMCDAMSHRGPDGEGYLIAGDFENQGNWHGKKTPEQFKYISNNRQVLLGHLRLSIIDLSPSANQPMADYNGDYWIVFNGEIYNHIELREELENAGYKFKTDHSDTEMILNAYDFWGKECLQKFNGMFAFSIWDKRNDSFFIARDRLGIKPFYFTIQDGVFYFASELRALLVEKITEVKLNIDSVYNYLTYLTIPGNETMIEGIEKLKPGHYFEIKQGKILEPVQYWDILKVSQVKKRSEEEIKKELLLQFEKAASRRMLADVEVGVLLSGGIDSSANLAMLSKFTNKKIKAFSIGFSNEIPNYENEFFYARKVAKKFNADYFEIEIDQATFTNELVNILRNQDEPNADTANIPIYLISKKAKEEGVTVLLGGEGSDELLVGYGNWIRIFDYYRLVESTPLKYLAGVLKKFNYKSWYNNTYKRWLNKTSYGETAFWSSNEILNEREKKNLLNQHVKKSHTFTSSFEPLEGLFKNYKSSKRHYYDWMSYSDISFRLPELLLARLDRMTMAASIEGRVPFLDHEFVEFCMSIEADKKADNNESKSILKKALEGILPNDILYRQKKGFVVPMKNLLFESDQFELFVNEIKSFNSKLNLFDDQSINDIINKKDGKLFWIILSLSMWYNNILKNKIKK